MLKRAICVSGIERGRHGVCCMILIVEDDPSISKFYCINLQARNYNVLQSATVGDALKILEAHRPALMILDIRLPDGRGWDLLRILEERQVAYFPVIVATASVTPLEVEEHEFSRITHILFKPIPSHELMRSVE